MKYSTQELKTMAAQAMDLFERMSGGVSASNSRSHQRISERLARWRQSVTGDNHTDSFEKRLSFSNLEQKKIFSCIGEVELPAGAPLPQWASVLAEIFEEYRPGDGGDLLNTKNRFPFEELLLPFVQYARKEIAPVRINTTLISKKAWWLLERALLWRLTSHTNLALWQRYQVFSSTMNPLGLIEKKRARAKTTRSLYLSFVKKMFDGEWKVFLKEFPVLGRLLVLMVEQWVASVEEFCERLTDDLPEIEALFRGGKPAGKVSSISSMLSDAHHGGKTVFKLEFDSGLKLIYKPKNLDTEKAFYSLLEWLNKAGASPDFKTRKLLSKKNYGWLEYLEISSCKSKEEIARYYRRSGSLLALVYLLDGTDCHSENIIACGQHPVLIDAETLFQPRLRAWDEKPGEESAVHLADDFLENSVLRTAMLPIWQAGRSGKSFDTSALAASPAQGTGYQVPRWKNVNTDQMELTYGESVLSDPDSCPKLKGRMISVEQFVDEVVEGFEQFYRFAMKHKTILQSKKGPLSPFANAEVRTVYRPTYVYALLQYRLLHPDYLRDGADRSFEIEVLTRNILTESRKDGAAARLAAYEAERQALERLDIPCFSTKCASRGLYADGKKITDNFFNKTSLEQVRERLKNLSGEEMALQAGTIRASLQLRFAAGIEEGKRIAAAKKENRPKLSSITPFSSKELTHEAIAIAQKMEENAIRSPDGGVSWVTVGFEQNTEKLKLMVLAESLYDGQSGIPLFLGALFQKTGNSHWRKMALGVLQPLRRTLKNGPWRRALLRQKGLGACVGVGGFLYSLVAAGRFLEEKGLKKEALALAGSLREEDLRQDTAMDLTSGGAGFILGLLGLAKAAPADKSLLKKAVVSGRHLLSQRVAAPSGHRVWKIPEATHPLTGFSHGAAGCAMALLRLYEATEIKDFLDAGLEAIDYERSVYLPEEKNWPDFRSFMMKENEPPSCANKWCHGASGIGLARVATLDILDDEEVRQEIKNAAATTRTADPRGYDYVCCGNFGRMELLIEAGKKLNRPEWIEEARRVATWSVRRARRTGGYSLYASADHVLSSPSFFQGLSGIGYQLLRLTDPKLPSVLSFK